MRMTKTGVMLGTPRYMAPEQIRSAKDVDPRVDIYALGVIVHEALTGQSPFPAQDAGQLLGCVIEGRIVRIEDIRPDLPPGLGDVIRRAMTKDRGNRYATLGTFAEAYARTLGVTLPRARAGATGEVPIPQLPPEARTEVISIPTAPEKPRFTMPEGIPAATFAPTVPQQPKKKSRVLLFVFGFLVALIVVACLSGVVAAIVMHAVPDLGSLDRLRSLIPPR
jgi:serine/threonine-protein kinase